ncbi:MAG: PP2C family protein-serine/threonine phosphatase [Candidatus Sumerlaeota bacterium]
MTIEPTPFSPDSLLDEINRDQKILVAEDEAVSRRMLIRQIEGAGYEVDEAVDGRQAIEKIKANPPNLLVCDWLMPGVTGVEICKFLKSHPDRNNIYCLMLSSKSEQEDIIEALDSGADDFLRKPWDKGELLARIRSGLRIEELQRILSLRNRENERLVKRLHDEMQNVAKIQRSMLPQKLPETGNIQFCPFYLPCSESGGDYYDVVNLADNRIGIAISDVSGHGAPAAVTMALLRHSFHMLMNDYDEPSELLATLNRMLYDNLTSDDYATMFYAIFDSETMTCTYSSAGHNPPVLYRAGTGTAEPLPKCQGFPLKLVSRDAQYRQNSIQFHTGDRLLFYTDGIPEIMNSEREMYTLERFLDSVQRHAPDSSLEVLQSQVLSEVMQFREGKMPDDDITLVIAGIKS